MQRGKRCFVTIEVSIETNSKTSDNNSDDIFTMATDAFALQIFTPELN